MKYIISFIAVLCIIITNSSAQPCGGTSIPCLDCMCEMNVSAPGLKEEIRTMVIEIDNPHCIFTVYYRIRCDEGPCVNTPRFRIDSMVSQNTDLNCAPCNFNTASDMQTILSKAERILILKGLMFNPCNVPNHTNLNSNQTLYASRPICWKKETSSQGGPFGSINRMKLSPCDVAGCCVTKYCYRVSSTGQITLVELASAPCPDPNTIDCSIQSGCTPQTYKVCGDD